MTNTELKQKLKENEDSIQSSKKFIEQAPSHADYILGMYQRQLERNAEMLAKYPNDEFLQSQKRTFEERIAEAQDYKDKITKLASDVQATVRRRRALMGSP